MTAVNRKSSVKPRKPWNNACVNQEFARLRVVCLDTRCIKTHKARVKVVCYGPKHTPHTKPVVKVIWGQHLRSGKTRSCGCLRRETSRITGKALSAKRWANAVKTAEFYAELREKLGKL